MPPEHPPAENRTSMRAADDLADRAVKVFQRRTTRPFNREDGRESLANLTGFFRELLDWRREDEAKARAAGGAR